MLVLSDTQRLGIDLHKLRQRIHQTAPDGHRSPHGHILVRKLFPGHLGSGVDRCTVLAHGEDLDILRNPHTTYEILRLPGGRTVADGDDFDGIFINHRGHCHDGLDLLALRRMREYYLVMQQVSLLVQADDLAAVAEPRVDCHRPFLADWRRQEQLGQIVAKDIDGLNVSLFLSLLKDLVGKGRCQQTLVGVIHRLTDLIGEPGSRIAVLLAEIIVDLVAAFLRIGIQADGEKALVLSPENGQEIVCRDPLQRHREIEISPELGCLRIT